MSQDEDEYSINWFIAQIKESAGDASVWFDREDLNDRTRWARWPGQTEDGKKNGKVLGYDPFPFEGSSDIRVRLCDQICNDMTDIMISAVRQASIKIVSTGSTGSMPQASLSTQVFQWMLFTQMKKELMRELKLAAEWRQQRGLTFIQVVWVQDTALEMREITLDDLVQIVSENPKDETAVLGLEALRPGGSDGIAIEFLQNLIPDLDDSDYERMVEELRADGKAEWKAEYLVKNRPSIKALRCYEEVFLPTNTHESQSSRWWVHRDWLTEDEVKDKENTDGWSPEFIEEVLKKPGDSFLETTRERQRITSFENSVNDWAVLDPKDLYEICWVTYRRSDADGVPGIYRRVISGNTPEIDAYGEELLDYDHGEYQYHDCSRERNNREVLLSRGVGEIVNTWQREKKTQRDFQTDASSMAILPPIKVKPSRSDAKLKFGPAAQIPVKSGDDVNFLQPPNNYNGSELVLNHLEQEVKDYFGIYSDDPDRRAIARQNLVDGWFDDIESVFTQIWQLMQQFMDPVDIVLQTGGPPETVRVDRKMIQGQYQVKLQFDARDLDTEFQTKRMEFLKDTIIPLDTDAAIDRGMLAKRMYEWIDPVGAQEIVKPVETITQSEIDAEETDLTKIWAGLQPPLYQGGINAQLRLQVAEEALNKNPNIKERYGSDGIYKAMLDAHINNLQFLVDQEQNKEIGKTGVKPPLP